MLRNNLQHFWNIVNPSERPGAVLNNDDENIVAANECAFVLNELFAKSFSNLTNSSYADFPRHNFCVMNSIDLECACIMNIIADLKQSSSCGIYNVNSKFLKKHYYVFQCYSNKTIPSITRTLYPSRGLERGEGYSYP